MRKELILLLLLSTLLLSSINVVSISSTNELSPSLQVIRLYTGPQIGKLVSVTYDPTNGFIYAVDVQHNDVVIFDPYNYSIIGTITVGVKPVYITYFNGYLYVVNQGSGTISVINPSNNKLVKTIYIGGSPSEVVLTNSYNYVVDNGIEVFNQNWQKVGTILSGDSISSVVYDPNTGLVYVLWTSLYSIGVTVSIVNGMKITDNASIILYVPFKLIVGEKHIYGFSPDTLTVFNPYNLSYKQISLSSWISSPCVVVYANGELYAYTESYSSIYLVNVSSGCVSTLTSSLTVYSLGLVITHGYSPTNMVYDPKTGMIYLVAQPPNPIIAINPSTGSFIAVGTQIQPQYILYDNVTGKLYVADHESDVIYVLTDGKVTGIIPTIPYPEVMTYNTRNGVLYVTNGGTLIAENPYNGSFLWNSTAGKDAVSLLYDSVDNMVYVADNSTNLVLAISAKNGSIVSAVQVGTNPIALAYDPQNGLVYVADYNGECVSVINGTQLVNSIKLSFKPTAIAFGGGKLFVGGAIGNEHYIAVIEGGKVINTIKIDSTPTQIVYYKGYLIVYVQPILSYSGIVEKGPELLIIKSNSIIAETPINIYSPVSIAISNNMLYVSPQYQYNEIYEVPLSEIMQTTVTHTTTIHTITITTTTHTTTVTKTTTSVTTTLSTTSSAISLPLIIVIVIVVVAVVVGIVFALRKR